jgi:hypothetical protein
MGAVKSSRFSFPLKTKAIRDIFELCTAFFFFYKNGFVEPVFSFCT